MACYLPALRWMAVAGVAAWLLWHKAITHVLAVTGLVLAVLLAAAVTAGVAVMAARVARRIQRHRARAGGCTTCRLPCQLAMTVIVPARRGPARVRDWVPDPVPDRDAAGGVPARVSSAA